MRNPRFLLVLVVIVIFAACSGDGDGENNGAADTGDEVIDDTGAVEDGGDPDTTPEPVAPAVRFDADGEAFFDVPFPSDTRLREDGTPDLTSWDAAYDRGVPRLWIEAAEDLMQGWGLVSGVFVHFEGPISEDTLPGTVAETTDTSSGFSSVFLMTWIPTRRRPVDSFPSSANIEKTQVRFTMRICSGACLHSVWCARPTRRMRSW